MTSILLCTLGTSWPVIAEAYAFLAPEILPLYRRHPEWEKLLELKNECRLAAPDEIWVCTTQGEQTQKSLQNLLAWRNALPRAPRLRIWQADRTDQLAAREECARMRELIARACLAAHEHAHNGQVMLSLAGGRKTMSADMQWAAGLFGCQALLHVIGDDSRIRQTPPFDGIEQNPALLNRELPEEAAKLVTPLVIGQTARSDLLDLNVDGAGPIRSVLYPLELPESGIAVFHDTLPSLTGELHKRERDSIRLFGNYLLELDRGDPHENWRTFYRLPLRQIEQLRQTHLDKTHRFWLTALPKADLHRHLGGCLDLDAQRAVAQAIWDALTPTQRDQALDGIQPLLEERDWSWDWPTQLKSRGVRSHQCAALLLHAGDERLLWNLWQTTEPRIALKARHPGGFSAYERPGELSGSALLGHPAAIAPYAEAILRQAVNEGLAYVELRGSPQKYQEDGVEFLHLFYRALADAQNREKTNILFRFIIAADRRACDGELQKTITMAVQARQKLPDFVAGLDLAGDEIGRAPEDIAHLFTPAFEACMPITIHAGEGESAESIWQAAYHLHADRIGHGLTLGGRPELAQRFRDRGICLELCPTSNREVVGFWDPQYPESAQYGTYPLMTLWQQGLPLTLCTDNPGISRTTLADEYLAAARMSGEKITLWDALSMIKQGFVHAFLPAQKKEKWLKAIDAQLYQLLTGG